jgi:hypothetical protein
MSVKRYFSNAEATLAFMEIQQVASVESLPGTRLQRTQSFRRPRQGLASPLLALGLHCGGPDRKLRLVWAVRKRLRRSRHRSGIAPEWTIGALGLQVRIRLVLGATAAAPWTIAGTFQRGT